MLQPRSERRVLGLSYQRVSLPSGEIRYVDVGSGPPILLLHGAPFTSVGFCRLIRRLRAKYRVVAPDLPGFGLSRASPAFGGLLADYARFIDEFWTLLELRELVVFACDSSACMALAAASGAPSRVKGFVIADTVPLPLTGIIALVRIILKYVVASRLMRFVNRRFNLIPRLVASVAPWRRPFSSEERARMIAQFSTPESRDRVIDVFGHMGQDVEFMQRTALDTQHHLAEKPALLVYGQFDPMRVLGAVTRYRRLFPRNQVHIVPFEEHFPMLAEGERVGDVIDGWVRALDRHGLLDNQSPPVNAQLTERAPGEVTS